MLGPRDRRHLEAAHPDLRRVVERAAREACVPFLIGPPPDATGRAIDLYPLLGRPASALRRPDFAHLVAELRAAARAEGVALLHGLDHGGLAARHVLPAEEPAS
jgi:hypothetical protein